MGGPNAMKLYTKLAGVQLTSSIGRLLFSSSQYGGRSYDVLLFSFLEKTGEQISMKFSKKLINIPSMYLLPLRIFSPFWSGGCSYYIPPRSLIFSIESWMLITIEFDIGQLLHISNERENILEDILFFRVCWYFFSKFILFQQITLLNRFVHLF